MATFVKKNGHFYHLPPSGVLEHSVSLLFSSQAIKCHQHFEKKPNSCKIDEEITWEVVSLIVVYYNYLISVRLIFNWETDQQNILYTIA